MEKKMAERNLDFDTVIDRRGTNSLKYDFAEQNGMPADIMPLWVADMDFRISSYIQDAIAAQAAHGIYGYSDRKESYFEAVSSWMRSRHNWEVQPEWLVNTPGVVFALAMAVRAYTEPGDAVMIQQPVYYPFAGVIKNNGRRVISNTLVQGEDGRYHMDMADFEQKLTREKIKLFILCSPHNPVGRVWDREELEAVGDLCVKYGAVVVSDEIHADFTYGKQHFVFAALKEAYREISVICTAPSKTFNIAGLQVSNIFIPNRELRKKLCAELAAASYRELNAVGMTACEAAYRHGGEWYEAMLAYVKENIDFTKAFLEERLPEIKLTETEGTYLLWLDFRSFGMKERELEEFIAHKAGLWLDGGTMFGKTGAGFQRVNAACPRATLKLALEKLERAVRERKSL